MKLTLEPHAVDQRIQQIIILLLQISATKFSPACCKEGFVQWDSLLQMQLITALESEFSIEFSDQQVTQLVSYQAIRQAIYVLLGLSAGE